MKPICYTLCLFLILLCRHGTFTEHAFAIAVWAVTITLISRSR